MRIDEIRELSNDALKDAIVEISVRMDALCVLEHRGDPVYADLMALFFERNAMRFELAERRGSRS